MKSLVLFICIVCLPSKNQGQSCFTRQEKEDMVETILLQKDVFSYLHLELEERRPIRIIKNSFFNELDSIAIEKTYVKWVGSLNKNNTRIELKIKVTSCTRKEVFFSFSSPIEGALVEGNVKRENSVWKIEVLKDIEF